MRRSLTSTSPTVMPSCVSTASAGSERRGRITSTARLLWPNSSLGSRNGYPLSRMWACKQQQQQHLNTEIHHANSCEESSSEQSLNSSAMSSAPLILV
ncbi:hypothetical protein EYF80_029707 [Liparis tanakae]|uniref:Uncharacterized protein n=1 Tax=Liparis tanakae TaxID=230148 RepID=A0A4Z2H2E3_9TELE|nr:hypothetical protein EYF80_029707 [Liparis tanakae]